MSLFIQEAKLPFLVETGIGLGDNIVRNWTTNKRANKQYRQPYTAMVTCYININVK